MPHAKLTLARLESLLMTACDALRGNMETVLDYIVVHELCHCHHRDHSDAFWNEVDKVFPDYREHKQWLRVRGAQLEL